MATQLKPIKDWWLYLDYGSLRFSCRVPVRAEAQAQRFCKVLENQTGLRFRADNRRDTPYDTFSYRLRATTKTPLTTYAVIENPKEVASEVARLQALNQDRKVFWIKDFTGYPDFRVAYKIVSIA